MTDHSALIERLEKYSPTNEWGDKVHHTICDEAAAALRDQQRRLDMWEPKPTSTSARSSGMASILAKQSADTSRRLHPLPSAPSQAKEAGE